MRTPMDLIIAEAASKLGNSKVETLTTNMKQTTASYNLNENHFLLKLFPTELFTLGNGSMTRKTDMDSRYGLMDRSMKANGRMIKQMVRVD